MNIFNELFNLTCGFVEVSDVFPAFLTILLFYMPRKHVKYQNRLKMPGKDIYFGLHVDFNYMYVWFTLFTCLFICFCFGHFI